MTSTRDKIIEITSTLLEAQGYHATGLNQILQESGAPKGSLYYYFPAGKEELVVAAIQHSSHMVVERIRSELARIEDPAESVRVFVQQVAHQVEASGFSGGGPLTTVALETVNSSERINHACQVAYEQLQQAFREKLLSSGYTEGRATQLATFIISAIEGGILLSRVNHSSEPLRQVGEELGQFLSIVTHT